MKIPLQWKVGFTPRADCMPENFIPAVVPGAVQLDWAAAQSWPAIEYQADYPVRYDKRNVPIAVDYEWMEDVYWLYRTELNYVTPLNGQRLYFVCGGVDYRFQVRLNSQVLCDQEGMFTPVEIDITEMAKLGDFLEVSRVLDQESRSIITRLRSHASVVLWCGGNELFNNWSRMTDQDLALRLLDRNCFDLDPKRPFIMTSPLSGWAHGGYQFRLRNGNEVYQYFPKARNTAYTEFGVPGIANKKLLERIIPAKELFPPHPGTYWQARHAFRAWERSPDSWLELWCVEYYFGEPANLEQLIACSQWLQCEGLKCVFEEARRQKPVCSMAFNWCFNEPWPSAANNSLLSWPAESKPSLKAVGAALRPVLASARIPKFSWKVGETFTADLYLLNDSPEEVLKGRIDALLRIAKKEIPLLRWNHTKTAGNVNLCGPTLRCSLPDLPARQFELILRVRDHPEWNSQYVLQICEK